MPKIKPTTTLAVKLFLASIIIIVISFASNVYADIDFIKSASSLCILGIGLFIGALGGFTLLEATAPQTESKPNVKKKLVIAKELQ